MIDNYMWGKINRLSPEAPVPVVDITKKECRLGGAANVALNIKALGAIPILFTVIGDDLKGKEFLNLMRIEELSTEGIMTEVNRKTTIKTRIIAEENHQLRVDEEDLHAIKNEDYFIKSIQKYIHNSDIIIFQDYNKGVLTEKIINKIISLANKSSIQTIVDPKVDNFLLYKNCTAFKPNYFEIKQALKLDFQKENISMLKIATQNLLNMLSAKYIILTLSENGICITNKENFIHSPAYANKIVDVSGAGDTVLSVAALCLTVDIKDEILSKILNIAGSIVCQEVGVVPLKIKLLLKEVKKNIHDKTIQEE